VFDHARTLEREIEIRFHRIEPDILAALRRVTDNATVFVTRRHENTSHYYRSQIIQNARNHYNYFADTSSYRSWVCLNMNWQRRAKLVFTVHGMGSPFSGTLVCAPFIEFRDTDDDGQDRDTVIPVAEEAFVFFYNETEQEVLNRFREWREHVLVIALRELTTNL
jgi:hypothetical protein